MNFFMGTTETLEIENQPPRSPLAQVLEPRIMFDGAGVATTLEATDATVSESERADKNQVVVVDTSVKDYQKLLEAVSPEAKLILIQGDQDGFEALAKELSAFEKIDALHIISHGDVGQLHLGQAVLTKDNLAEYDDALSIIGQAMAETGDILIYGCNIAGDVTGVQFVNDLALVTGADIAASEDLTGATSLGGNWDLEIVQGDVEETRPFSEAALQSFDHVLEIEGFETGWSSTPATSISGDIGGATFEIVGNNSEAKIYQYHGASYAQNGTKSIYLADGNGNNGTAVTATIQRSGGTDDWTLAALHVFAYDATDDVTITPYLNGGELSSEIKTVTKTQKSPLTWANLTVDKLVISSGQSLGVYIDDLNATPLAANQLPDLGGTPADDTATEDVATAIDLSAYNVSDDDGDNITLTLAVDRGTIASTDGNGTFSGVTVSNTATSSMTLAGTAANLNTYLNDTSKITYTTAANDTTTAVLTVTPNDGKGNGTADTVNISITAVNDRPTVSGAPTDVSVTEDTESNINLSAMSFADVDSASLTLTLTASAGTFSTPADGAGVGGGVSETLTNAQTITLVGAAADINTYLDTPTNIKYTAASNVNGNNAATITVSASDGSASLAANPSININVTAVNDAPVLDNSKSPTMSSITEDLAAPTNGSTANSILVAGLIDNGGSLSNYTDVEGDPIGIAITAVNANGTLHYSTDGGTNWSAVGAVAANSARLLHADANTRVYFQPAANYNGSLTDAFTFKAWDRTGGHANGAATVDTTSGTAFSSATDTVALTVSAVNDDPTVASMPTDITVTEDTASNVDLSAITFSDVDSAANSISLVLTVGAGTLTASSSGGVSVSNSGTTAITLSGTASNIDTYLNTASNIKYTGAANASGNNVTTLNLTSNDGGAVGAGGGNNVNHGNININITNVNDAPTVSGAPTDVTVTEDTESNIDLSAMSFADIDGDSLTLTLTASAGTFSTPVDGAGVGAGVTENLVNATTITLAGSAADLATYLDTASNIKYTGATNAAGDNAATITVSASDGNGGSFASNPSINIDITAVNDLPTAVTDSDNSSGAGGGNFTTSFSAGGSAVSVSDSDFVITDVDDTHIESATIVLSGNADGGESITISGTPASSNGISITYTSATQISLSGSATKAAYQTVIESIVYQNTNAAGSTTTGNRTVTITVNDGDGNDASPPTTTISVVTAPIIDLDGTATGTGKTASFTEGGGAVSIVAADATISDTDSANLNQLVIQITNAQTGDILKVGARNNADVVNGITITENSSSQITLSGSATKANYLALIKELTFNNTSEAPSTTTRTITFSGRDTDGNSGSVATTSVSVAAVNDAPAFAGLDGTPNPDENVAVVLDANATLSDAELDAANNYIGATLSLSRNGGANANDTFANTGTLGALTQGGNLTLGGTNIGTVTTNSSGTLLLTFNASATSALVDSTLQQITYANASDTESGNIQIDFSFSDGTTISQGSGGAQTASGSITLNVAAVNDAPSFTGLDATPAYTKTSSAIVLDANATIADAELDNGNNYNGATLQIVRNGGASANDQFEGSSTLYGAADNATLTEGGALKVGSTTIGTVTTNSGGTLLLTFNANATSVLVDSALQKIAYSAANAQTAGNVQLDWTFSDGTTVSQGSGGAKTATGSVSVDVQPKPALTSATYNANTGALVVTGEGIVANSGGSDIDASLLTLTGEGGATYTLTDTADVNRTSSTEFTLTLSATDKAALNQILNKNLTTSTGGTTYNIAGADNWATGAASSLDIADTTGNAVTVSNVAAPTMTSVTYSNSGGTLVLTGENFTKFAGANNDIDASLITITGEGNATYTLNDTSDVEITSGTSATLTLSATDKAGVEALLTKTGTTSADNTTYNLALAEDWARGADAAVNVVDATNALTATITAPAPAATDTGVVNISPPPDVPSLPASVIVGPVLSDQGLGGDKPMLGDSSGVNIGNGAPNQNITSITTAQIMSTGGNAGLTNLATITDPSAGVNAMSIVRNVVTGNDSTLNSFYGARSNLGGGDPQGQGGDFAGGNLGSLISNSAAGGGFDTGGFDGQFSFTEAPADAEAPGNPQLADRFGEKKFTTADLLGDIPSDDIFEVAEPAMAEDLRLQQALDHSELYLTSFSKQIAQKSVNAQSQALEKALAFLG